MEIPLDYERGHVAQLYSHGERSKISIDRNRKQFPKARKIN
jgi:hypothetical protein